MLKNLLSQGSEFKKAFSKQLLKLVASAFGLVAALAWNEVIKETVSVYIKPVAGESSGLISLLIYALIVTILAVFVTYYLTRSVGKDTS
jgi:predicted PurR-regulated permease PerM